MNKRKPASKVPAKRDSRKQQKTPLPFDNVNSSELIELTPEEKAEVFLSKYLEKMNPVGRYKDYFDNSGYSVSHLLKNVKTHYRSLVLDKEWPEEKFVTITNEIFDTDRVFSPGTYDFMSKLYNNNELESQKKTSSRLRRRL